MIAVRSRFEAGGALEKLADPVLQAAETVEKDSDLVEKVSNPLLHGREQ